MTQFAQPGYPPQAPVQQPYAAPPAQQFTPPQQYGAPQQYAPQPQVQYAPPPQQPMYGQQPGYGWPQGQPAPAPAPLAQGSIDDFYSQPSTGGAFLKFNAPGDTYVGIVAHTPGKGDVRQITTPPNQGSVPQFYRDGRPKYEMLVTLKMQPTQANPEGIGIWPVKGADRDELARAMAEVGAPEGPPEAGALVQITFTHQQPTRGGIPRKVKQVIYVRPDQAGTVGMQQTPAPAAQAVAPQQFAQQPQYGQPMVPQQQFVPQQAAPPQAAQFTAPAQAPVQQQVQTPAQAPQVPQQFMPQPQAQAAAPEQQAPQQQQMAPQQPAAPAGMTEAQQQLIARLSGQPAS